MFKGLIHNLQSAGIIKGGLAEKVSVFLTLSRLQLKNKINGKKTSVVKENFFGYKVNGYDYEALSFLFNEVFISGDYYFKASSGQPVVVDCGANIGTAVLYFKKLYPKSKIIAFEANPSAFKLLQKNVSENDLNNVEMHNIALYDKETEISFFTGGKSASLVASINQDRGGDGEIKVKAGKLSSYLENSETIDLVKMDVEGAEINIVNDLIESQMLGKPKEYIIEYHHNINDNQNGLPAFLQKFESHGFRYNIKANYSGADMVQDILIHFYRK